MKEHNRRTNYYYLCISFMTDIQDAQTIFCTLNEKRFFQTFKVSLKIYDVKSLD